MKIKQILLFVLLLSFFLGAYAQKHKVNRPIDDKLSTIEIQIQHILNNKNNKFNNVKSQKNFQNNKNSQFTDNDVLDIELHAAINPTDSNNIVISWMKMEPSNSSMPLVFSTYYTTDFGETWNEGSINFIPREIESNESMSGGGDPMIVFDTNGNVYIAWLYTIV